MNVKYYCENTTVIKSLSDGILLLCLISSADSSSKHFFVLSKGKCVNDAAQSGHDVRPLLDFVCLMEKLDLKTGFFGFVTRMLPKYQLCQTLNNQTTKI